MDKSKSELWDFLRALYEHGSNVERLQALLPDWTEAQICHALKRYRYRAQRKVAADEKNSQDASLNQWVMVMEHLHQIQGSTNNPWWRKGRKKLDEVPKDHAPTLSKVMMYASLYEDHYQGSSPDDPNYSEIYRYLSELLEGSEPMQLNPGSAAKVLEMLNRIKNVVTDENASSYLDLLIKTNVSYLPQKSSGETRKSSKRPVPEGEEKPSLSINQALADQTCPLFEDEEEEDIKLEPTDPYYELKKANKIQKIKSAQQTRASLVQDLPGLNPMEIPPEYLTKPTSVFLDD